MLREELGHVQDLAIDHDPAVLLGGVLGNLLHCVATSTTSTSNRYRSRGLAGRGFVHGVLVRATRELGAFYSTREAATREFIQGGLLHVITKHVLTAVFPGNAAEHYTVKQRVATQTVVAVHPTSHFTSRVQAWNGLAGCPDDRRVHIHFKTTHAVMDHWSDDRNVEWLALHRGSRNHIVVEFLSRSSLAARLIPRLARRVRRP